MEHKNDTPDWADLLVEAVNEPGQLADAYKYFHQYTLANRWLASTQLHAAGVSLSPINTFKGWLKAKRPVQKGQTANISLVVPVPVRAKSKDAEGKDEKGEVIFTKFMLRRGWFHLAQTDGEPFEAETVTRGDWSLASALEFLGIRETEFSFAGVGDRRLGYADGKTIAVSPLDPHPAYGCLREMSRVMLGHTEPVPGKAVPVEEVVRELEVEATAYLCAATLGINGLAEARARLQTMLLQEGKPRIPDKSANRAFSSADKLINAGYC